MSAVIPQWTFGDRLRKARHYAGLGQKEFAEALDTAAGSLAAWETDRSRPRDLVALAKRVEMLTRIPAAWLLGLDEWAPWGSNPQPTDQTSSQVSDDDIPDNVIAGPWARELADVMDGELA